MTNRETKNRNAAALARLGASKGGKARAEKLSAEERREIAQRAALARWEKSGKEPKLRAIYDGTLTFGRLELPCAVLEDGSRVISERAFAALLGAPRGGSAYEKRRESDGGAILPIYMASDRLRPFISKDLAEALSPPIEYVPRHGGRAAYGVKAELVPEVCDVWLRAREEGRLTQRQEVMAKKAEILVRGLAHVGIVALVDEVTGYQDARARDALAKILDAFIAKELRKWISTFPPDFYKELFRLRGWEFPKLPADQNKRPVLVGTLTNNIVYDRLAPGVRRELHRLTPRDKKGRLRHKLFQRLSDEVGHPKLREHLASVITLMKASDTWDQFKRMLDRSLPKYGDTIPLPYDDPMP